MDPQLPAQIVQYLAPFLPSLLEGAKLAGQEAAKKLGEKAGEQSLDQAKALWDKLHPKVEAKPAALEAAQDVADHPDNPALREALREEIARALAEDEALAQELARLLQQARPSGQTVIASGDRAVAIGGNPSRNVIFTGDIHIELNAHQPANLERLLDKPSTDVNPFLYGPPVPPERFYGRREQLAEIKNRIGAITAQCVNIVGQRRSGKTSILRYIQERSAQFFRPGQNPLMIHLDFQDKRFHTPGGIVEGLRRDIEQVTGNAPWSRIDNDDPYAVEDGLRTVQQQGRQLIILIDEFERISARLEHFQDWGEDWRAKVSAGLFVLVIATLRPLDEIYTRLNLTSPFANLFSTTILGALEEPDWHQLVRDGFEQSGQGEFFLANPTEHLALIDDLSGGLPYYVQMAATLLWQHHDPTKVREEFAFQARPRFWELWNDLSRPEQLALRAACGLSQTPPDPLVWDMLRRCGLLRPDGCPFSSAFADFVKTQPIHS